MEVVSVFRHNTVRVLGVPVMSSKQTMTVKGRGVRVEFVQDEQMRR